MQSTWIKRLSQDGDATQSAPQTQLISINIPTVFPTNISKLVLRFIGGLYGVQVAKRIIFRLKYWQSTLGL